MPESQFDSRIFILDDNETNLIVLEKLLKKVGYKNIECSSVPEQAEFIVESYDPDLVITDLHMPRVSGYEVLETLRNRADTSYLPILVFTADTGAEARQRALSLGATDFLTKPGDACEITLRVANFLQMRNLYRTLEEHNGELERKVLDRTQQLEDSQVEIVYRLALTAEYRDDDTGQHCKRVADMAHAIAIQYGLAPDQAHLIRLAAPLHDIGKVGIPDAILRKPGKLTLEEFQEIQHHTDLGARILADSQCEVLRMAYVIALTHHERWDGRGYGQGLAGEDIPIAGRIVAVADVFDALTSERAYKKAWSVPEAIGEIIRCSGSQFDPSVVAAFCRVTSDSSVDAAA